VRSEKKTVLLQKPGLIGLSAEKIWRKKRGFRQLTDVINCVKFIDGIDNEWVFGAGSGLK
jgi:hypothetical protein